MGHALQSEPGLDPSGLYATRLAGVRVVFDPAGAMLIPSEAALVVADLHFEKGSALTALGAGRLPPYDTRATLAGLAALIHTHQPAMVVALGDSFHDMQAAGRMAREDVADLQALVGSVSDWVWVEGNHDPQPPAHLGGRTAPLLELAGLTLRHEPTEGPAPGEVAGHLHPAARIRRRGRSVRRRCFASDGARLIMPAFGAYAGGLNVRDAAFAPCFADRPTAYMLGREQVWPVAGRHLLPD